MDREYGWNETRQNQNGPTNIQVRTYIHTYNCMHTYVCMAALNWFTDRTNVIVEMVEAKKQTTILYIKKVQPKIVIIKKKKNKRKAFGKENL